MDGLSDCLSARKRAEGRRTIVALTQTLTDLDEMLRSVYHHLLTDGNGVSLWDRPIQHMSEREQHARSLLIRLELWVDPYEPDTDPPNEEVQDEGSQSHDAA